MDDLYLDGEHYDALYPNKADPFWQTMAERYGDPVLELGCGTGRIAISLADQGFDITGIDNAPSMLSRAREKTAARGLEIDLHEADARHFKLDRQFNTIIFPANALCHILTREDFEALAASVRAHLTDTGAFVIDVFVPSQLTLSRDPDARYPYGKYKNQTGKAEVTYSGHYDNATQINHITMYTQIGQETPVQGQLNMRMYYPQELDALLAYNGLPVDTRYGTVDLGPFTAESGRQLIVCRKG